MVRAFVDHVRGNRNAIMSHCSSETTHRYHGNSNVVYRSIDRRYVFVDCRLVDSLFVEGTFDFSIVVERREEQSIRFASSQRIQLLLSQWNDLFRFTRVDLDPSGDFRVAGDFRENQKPKCQLEERKTLWIGAGYVCVDLCVVHVHFYWC